MSNKEKISGYSKRLTSAVLAMAVMATSSFSGVAPALAHVRDFVDTDATAWYAHAVTFVSENHYMVGYGNGVAEFGIGKTLTRAELASILANYKNANIGSNAINKTGLSDVQDGKWYTGVCNWAVKEKLIVGYADGTFRPNAPITREEIAVILCRFVDGETGQEEKLKNFADRFGISDWAWNSLGWATYHGVISGIQESNGLYLRPLNKVTREQMAAILERLDRYVDKYGYGYREDGKEDKPEEPQEPEKPQEPSYEVGAPGLTLYTPEYVYVDNRIKVRTSIRNSDDNDIEWTITRNNTVATQNDVFTSLDNDGGTIKFYRQGTYKVYATLQNHNGKKTTRVKTITVLAANKIVINSVEQGYTQTPLSVEIITPPSKFVENVETSLIRNGESVKWKDYVKGNLTLDGGDLTFKKAGNYDVIIILRDSDGFRTERTIHFKIFAKGTVLIEGPDRTWVDTVNKLTVTTKNTNKNDIVWTIKKNGKEASKSDFVGNLNNNGGEITFKKAGKYEIIANTKDKLNNSVSASKVIEVIDNGQIELEASEYGYTDMITKISVNTNVKDADVKWSVTKDDKDFDYSSAGILNNTGGNLKFAESGVYKITATIIDSGDREYTDTVTVNILPTSDIDVNADNAEVTINDPVNIAFSQADKERLVAFDVIAKKDGSSIKWEDYITGEISMIENNDLIFKEAGDYELSITATDKGGRLFTKTIAIKVLNRL